MLRFVEVFRTEYVKKLETAQRLCFEMYAGILKICFKKFLKTCPKRFPIGFRCEQMSAMRKKQESDVKSLSNKNDRIKQRQCLIVQRLDTFNDVQNTLLAKYVVVRKFSRFRLV